MTLVLSKYEKLLCLVAVNILALLIVTCLPINYSALFILMLILILMICKYNIHVLQLLIISTLPLSMVNDSLLRVQLIAYNGLFGVLIIYYLTYLSLYSSAHNRLSNQHIFAFMLFVFAFLALTSMIVNSKFNQPAILEIIRYFSLPFLFFIIYFYLNDIKLIKKIILTICVISLIFSIYSYFLLYHMGIQGFLISGIITLRASDLTVANPNAIAMIIGYPLPFIFSYLFFADNKKSKKSVYFLMAFIMIIWLLWNSRSTYVYLFCALLVLIWFHRNRIKYYLGISFIALSVISFILFSPIAQQFLRIESGLSFRDELWRAAIRIFMEYPIWGIGPSGFESSKFHFLNISQARNALLDFSGAGAHNFFLNKAAELGLFACITAIALIVLVIVIFIINRKYIERLKYRYIYLGSFACFIGMIARSFFEAGDLIGYGRLGSNIIPFIIVAIIMRIPYLMNKQASDSLNSGSEGMN